MLIEIHIIQNHSPSNLNRDDLGAPKTCVFGGVTRARISSQCLKRSIRNPGNPEDIHNRGAGLFATTMAGHVGVRTKFFPWLVEQELARSTIPREEHSRIVLAATHIATSQDREAKQTSAAERGDARPKTAQLIHLGPGHAKYYVQRLTELRDKRRDQYDFFLNPRVSFEELVGGLLAESTLEEGPRKSVQKAAWVIAKCRMAQMLKASKEGEAESEPELIDGQPGPEHARLVAEILCELHSSDQSWFKELTNRATHEEKTRIGQDAPSKPKGMEEFMGALKDVTHLDAVDIALFGRMTTSDAFEDVEAAIQVAHAISTHAVVNEVDYFTAVDDLGKSGGGAGHVDEAMFNSACFYKYFSLDWDQLLRNLKGPEADERQVEVLAVRTIGHFLEAAALSNPSGKQNSFAANCEPCGILVEIKTNGKIPTSYANAFAEPVERIGKPDDDAPDEQSLEGRSVACLADHVQSMRKAYGTESTLLWYSPKLWRFPLRYWQRDEDGRRQVPALVTGRRFTTLDGLVEALVGDVLPGCLWAEVKTAERTTAAED